MKIGINIEQTTTHNFTKLNVKILSISFFTVPKLVDGWGTQRRHKLGDQNKTNFYLQSVCRLKVDNILKYIKQYMLMFPFIEYNLCASFTCVRVEL